MTRADEELFFLDIEERNAAFYLTGKRITKGENESLAWTLIQSLQADFEEEEEEG